MPVTLKNDNRDYEGSSCSTHPTGAVMVQEGRPAKRSQWRGRLVLMGSLAAFLVILQSHQEPGKTLSLGFTQAMAQT
jgi:hypothetical protein